MISTIINQQPFFYYITLLCYFIFPPLAFFMPRSSTILLAILVALSLPNFSEKKYRENFKTKFYTQKPLLFFTTLLISWMLFSSYQSYPFKEPFYISIKFIGLIFAGVLFFSYMDYFSKVEKHNFFKALTFGCFITALIIIAEHFLGNTYAHFKQCDPARIYAKPSLILSVIAPLIIFSVTKPIYKLFTIIYFSITFYFCYCDTAFLAYIIGILTIIFLHFESLRSYLTKISITTTLVTLFTLPFLMPKAINFYEYSKEKKILACEEISYLHRLDIWKIISEKITQKPLLGHGINASKNDNVMDGIQTFHHQCHDKETTFTYKIHHPHNYILQVWLELGFVGIILFSFVFIFIIMNIQYTKSLYFSGFILLFAAHIHLLFSISIWQTWWWISLCLICPLLKYIRNNNE